MTAAPALAGHGAKRFLVLVTCFLAQMLAIGAVVSLIGVSADAISRDIARSPASVLAATSSPLYLAMSLMSPLVGAASGKLSLRVNLLIGIGCVACGFFVLAHATSLLHLILAFGLLFGFGVVNIQLATPALAARSFESHRGRALGLVAIGISTAGVLLAPWFAYVSPIFGWRGAVTQLGWMALALLVPMWFATTGLASAAGPAQAMRVEAMGKYLRSRVLWGIILSAATSAVVLIVIMGNLRAIAGGGGFVGARTAALFSILSASSIAGKLLFAWRGDRFGERLIARAPPCLGALAAALLVLPGQYWALVAAMVAIGLSGGLALPGQQTLIARRFHKTEFLAAFGTSILFITPASVLAPPLVAWAGARLGSFGPIFIGFAILLALSAWIAGSAFPKGGKPTPAAALAT